MIGGLYEMDSSRCHLSIPPTRHRRSTPFLGVDPLCYLGEERIRQILELGDLGYLLAPRGHTCRHSTMHVGQLSTPQSKAMAHMQKTHEVRAALKLGGPGTIQGMAV